MGMAESRVAKRNGSAVGGQWLVLAAAVLWGTTGTAQTFAPAGALPASVGAVRLVGGSLCLVALAAYRGQLGKLPLMPRRPLLVAAIGIALYQITFFAGVARTGVAVGTIVGIGTAPIWSGALDWLVVGDRPGWRWLAATALAIVGSALLIAGGSSISVDPLGVLLAMGAGLAYAVYTLASKQILYDFAPDGVMAAVFGLGAVFLLPVLFLADVSWLAEGRGALVALHLAVLTVGLSYALWSRGLIRVSASTAVTLSLGEPLTAATLGVLVVGERLPLVAGLGIALLVAGLALLSLGQTDDQPALAE
jgi:DME family drug/metabolite transporter